MIRYVGVATVARWLNVSPATITKYFSRYAESHPTPKPDAEIEPDGMKGWLPEREAEWRSWEAGRKGQGRGGGPKPKK